MARFPWSRGTADGPEAIAKRYGVATADLPEPAFEAFREQLTTLDPQSTEWAAVSAKYNRLLPAHLEACHGKSRSDREFRELSQTMVGGSNMLASITLEQMHHEAHGR